MQWDKIGERLYETGTRRGVLFVQDDKGKTGEGTPWSGLQAVKHAPDGAEPTKIYADDIVYAIMTSAENFKGSIEAFMSPVEFDACDGAANPVKGMKVGQQNRSQFGLVYNTKVGNDTVGTAYGEKMHFIYNARVSPSARDYTTVNDSPEAMPLTWSFETTPMETSLPNTLPTAYVCVDKKTVGEAAWAVLEDTVYGNGFDPTTSAPLVSKLLTPDEIAAIIQTNAPGGQEQG